VFFFLTGWSQTFPAPGQQPGTALPICGTGTLKQSNVPYGANGTIQYATCHHPVDFSPFYYSFTCYAAGTLGLLIVPDSLLDDYDWMLFDITNHNPNDIYKINLVVDGNWSGTLGPTGAKEGGATTFQCGSEAAINHPTFSSMPTLKKDHKYLLLVSNYSEKQSGYSLTIEGGTAQLNDPTPPVLQSAFVGCNKQVITVTLDKNVRCNSLAPDGSDFVLSSGFISIIGATGINCNNQFDMDSIQLMLSAPLVPGNYTVTLKTGTDGNTLLDDCANSVVAGEKENFNVSAPQSTDMDSLTPPNCAANNLQLVFSTPMQCSSIAPNGSDFLITGSSAVGISKANGQCIGGLTNTVIVKLVSPLVVGGNYKITLVKGNDGNTLYNECGIPSTAGSMISFVMKDTVTADFGYQIAYGCVYDSIKINYAGGNGVNQWQWDIDHMGVSSMLAPVLTESEFNIKNLEHIVSNGFCNDTITKSINLDNSLKAIFESNKEVCPKDVVTFTESSTGNLISWHWDFGDGTTSNSQTPPDHLFPDTWAGKSYMINLIVENNIGCFDTASTIILKKQSCAIAVPNAFTPNGDGKNDYLYPLNAYNTTNLEFLVFNRFGQLVFETRDWTKKWDGRMNGQPAETGTYVWMLTYTDGSGKKQSQRGTTILIR
jgi:gliding motility-associated-like protein